MTDPGQRLLQAIEMAGYEHVSDFAEVAGVKDGTLRQQIARGSIPTEAVELYVRKLRRIGLTTDWLLFKKGPAPGPLKDSPIVPTPPPGGELSIPITHVVGAGDEVYPFTGDEPIGYTRTPPGFAGGAAAIRGDSMEPLFDDKDVIFYRPWEDPPAVPSRRPVILRLRDGRSFLKKLLPGSKPGRYHLISINPSTKPILDARVVSVARIWWVHFEGLDGDDGVDPRHADEFTSGRPRPPADKHR